MHLKTVMASFGACWLCSCSVLVPVAQEQKIADQFATGVHTVGAAEITFLRHVQSVECIRTFYDGAFAFASAEKDPRTGAYPGVVLDLLPTCHPAELTAAQLQGRQAVMNLLAAYADSIQALMSRESDRAFDASSESMAKELQGVAKQAGFTAINANEVAGVNAAIDTITQLFVNRHEYHNVKDAASKAEPALEVIVTALKSENTVDAAGIQSKMGDVKNEFRVAIIASRDHKNAASFLDIADAHAMLASMTVVADPSPLNAALDALVTTNQALARGDKATERQVVANLVSEGKDAVAIFNGSK